MTDPIADAPSPEPHGGAHVSPSVVLEVFRDRLTGGIQVAIGKKDGGGYRLMGPKFVGDSTWLAGRTLRQRDADELRQWADRIEEAERA